MTAGTRAKQPPNRAVLLLGAGFALLLAGGIALMFGLKGPADPQPRKDVVKPDEPEKPPPPPEAKSGDHVFAAPRDPKKFPEIKRAPNQVPSIAENIPKAEVDELQYRPDGKIMGIVDLDSLREGVAKTDYQVLDCINLHGGKAVTGQVVTTFLVARKKDESGKYVTVIESTGFEEDGTTITDPKLIECMHKTAQLVKFPPSNNPVAVWARRRITVDAGRLGDNWVTEHGYLR